MVVFIYNSFMGGPAAGKAWCTFYGLAGGLTGTGSIMTIAMMSVERYHCVSRPLDPSSKMTKKKAILMVIFVWVYSSVFSFMPLVGINRYVPEGFLTSCSFDYLSEDSTSKVFIIVFFFAAYCTPLITICRCYAGIVMSVCKNQQLFVHSSNSPSMPDRNVEMHKRMEIRLAKISLRLILLWTVAWTPYAIVALIGVSNSSHLLSPLISMLPALFCKIASVLDPFIYALSNQQFKDELVRKLLCFCPFYRTQNTRAIPDFVRRVIVVDEVSLSLENAEMSFSDDETSLNGNEIELNIRKVVSMNALELTSDGSLKDKSVQDNCGNHHSDSELRNRKLTSFLPQGNVNLDNSVSNKEYGNTLTVEVELPCYGKTDSSSSINSALGDKKCSNGEPGNQTNCDKINNVRKLRRFKSCDMLSNSLKHGDKINNVRKLRRFKSCDMSSNSLKLNQYFDSVSVPINKSNSDDLQKFLERNSSPEDAACSEQIEMNELRIHVVPIPQIHTIQSQDDVIKLRTRRSV
ncbi:hypothetical protein JTE90_008812 [Oedothorax gibbosus]|uniref:G-protein coupled receptors family 1 profile domain-containing protein n=1 Tax=Oedothorax gibbosus TaxID=931172 RepID=A0AAV6V5B9_9ARAC|nr:hypothetical protein JTE90_008812 [Oedothorax gibbosus]